MDKRKGLSKINKIFIGILFVIIVIGLIVSLYFGIKASI